MIEALQVLNPYIRNIILGATCMTIGYHLLHLTNGFRGKRWLGVLYVLYKAVLVNMLMRYLLGHYYSEELWWKWGYVWLSIGNIALNLVTFKTMFKGSFLKIILIQTIFEFLITLEFSVVNTVFNLIEGVPATSFFAPFRLLDLLSPIVLVAFYGITCYPLSARLKTLRDKEPGFRKILAGILIAYNVAALFSVLQDNLSSEEFFTFYGLILLITITGGSALGVAIFYLYRRKVLAEHQYYRLSSNLLESYYGELLAQTQQIYQYREYMNAQMKSIREMDEAELDKEQFQEYIKTLRNHYDEITAGVYCNDPVIDALLCQKEKECKEKQIHLVICFQNYVKGEAEHKKILLLLVTMLNEAIQCAVLETKMEKRSICLRCDTAANRLVFEVQQGNKKQKRVL